ncbi:16S rRNA (cytosine(967)-C(5))-methyltransferase RsmB [Pseudogracilibacillus sp. SE30717A]|uniref:16S rRNA (cytosine(967)-C(5))-methyltransferase RsmB n=1 Tax=Pseudogracilibacillus sp. SE30717A TaxID=3098293 RepID=UPI00300DD083
MQKEQNVRYIALDLLLRIEKEGSFSHLLLSQMIHKSKLSEQDERLLTEIVYGTMERKMTLDYYLTPFIQTPKKVTDWVMTLLRMSVFQLQFLDKIPAYAVIDESVEIAKHKGHRGIASFVNGILRNMLRKGVPALDKIPDPILQLSISTSHPKWLVERWVDQYGFDLTKQMCETNVTKKPISIRINRLRTTREQILDRLKDEGITAEGSPYCKDGIIIRNGNILKTNLIAEGLITVQDQSSMLASRTLQVEQNMQVLDTCSAPGGKATYLGELMNNKGTIHSYDLHKNKLKLIENNASRLGLTNIQVGQCDARSLQTVYKPETFDRILVDAPCSGLGVIRTKPDIKYNKNVEDINKLHDIQFAILEHIAPLLKKDGKIVYSTCTVDTTENEEVVRQFIKKHSNFYVDKTFLDELSIHSENARITEFGIQLFPHTIQSDGFFITRLEKNDH